MNYKNKENLGLDKEIIKKFYDTNDDGIVILEKFLHKNIPKEELLSWYTSGADEFEIKREKYIENNQKVSVVYNGPFDSAGAFENNTAQRLHQLYYDIRDTFSKLSLVPFASVERLETKLIYYPVSDLGVGAHKDLSSNMNIIVLMTVFGHAEFYTADDKCGTNEKKYTINPGDIMIMRGPRNRDENYLRRTHYIKNVVEQRLVFVCREIDTPTENIINKNNWMGF